MSPEGRSLAAIVVTHNSARHIVGCLRSIGETAAEDSVETVVVDNGSVDDTCQVVKDCFPAVRLLKNRKNRGFAAACNQGVAEGGGEFVLLLNPDAQLRAGVLGYMLDYLEAEPAVGIVGPALEAPSGELQRDISATGLFPSFRQALYEYTRLGRWRPDSPWVRDYFLAGFDRRSNRRVAMVQGACLLVRRRLLDQVGGLDERFFLYFEETDLCRLAAGLGQETHYLGRVAAVHLGSCSSPDDRPSAKHFIRSLYRFHRKHYGAMEALSLWLILAPYHALRTARMALRAIWVRDDLQLRADLKTAAERFVAHFHCPGGVF